MVVVFFFKQKTAYEMRISDWSSDVCSSDLRTQIGRRVLAVAATLDLERKLLALVQGSDAGALDRGDVDENVSRPVFRLDEAVALGRVETLASTVRHGGCLQNVERPAAPLRRGDHPADGEGSEKRRVGEE